jgi:hypothetical protein
MKFKVGDIVFFQYDDNIFSWMVQRYNILQYSITGPTHVGIIGEVKKDTVVIYEALDDGFVKNDYEKWWLNLKIDEKVIQIRKTKGLTKVKEACEKYLGRGYAWLDIVSIGLSYLLRFKFMGCTGARKLICSEAVARVLYDASRKKINFEAEYNKSYNTITPMDLYLSEQLYGN